MKDKTDDSSLQHGELCEVAWSCRASPPRPNGARLHHNPSKDHFHVGEGRRGDDLKGEAVLCRLETLLWVLPSVSLQKLTAQDGKIICFTFPVH